MHRILEDVRKNARKLRRQKKNPRKSRRQKGKSPNSRGQEEMYNRNLEDSRKRIY
jgi:hypothetical protein